MALPKPVFLVTTLAADHAIGDGTLVLQAGDGTRLGGLDSGQVYAITAVLAPGLGETIMANFLATGLSTDTLTGVAADDHSVDVDVLTGTPMQVRLTPAWLDAIQDGLALFDDPVAAASHDDAEYLHITGPETITGEKTYAARIVHDLAANASGLIAQAIPSVTSVLDDVVWGEGAYSFANGDGSYNHVFSRGWNVDSDGSSLDPTKISVRSLASEYRWKNGSIYQSEEHWFSLFYPGDPEEYRTITASAYHATKTCGVTINTSGFTIVDETRPSGNLLYGLTWDHAGSLQATYTVSGVMAGSFNFSPAGDSLQVGRTTATSTSIMCRGHAIQWDFIADTATWSHRLNTGSSDYELIKDGVLVAVYGGTTGTLGQVSLVAPAAQVGGSGILLFSGSGKQGYFRQDSSGNHIISPSSGSRLYFDLDGSFTTYMSSTTFSVGLTLAMTDAINMTFGTGTGTKFGTATGQKIGFFNATPVIQPATTGTATGFTAGAGTAVKDDSTFTGGVGSTAYRISDVVKALKNLGFLAQ